MTTPTARSIIVTGGASGIGRATVLLLAERGARVIVGDIDEAGGKAVVAEAKEKGLSVSFFPLDLTNADSVDHFAKVALASVDGRIDGLVNSAGWSSPKAFLDESPEQWTRVLGINLVGALRLTQAVARAMTTGGGGKVVNVASDAGRVGSGGEAVYSAAKGGMIAFTKSLARELARYKVNVNCVCPGPTDTPLFRSQIDDKRRSALISAIPFRRLAEPEEQAKAIWFLVSDNSDYMTGQVLSVSGGLTMAG
jgi:2-hydroxycyclohexanecarboxyl-CoA dehydrogenase